MKTYLSSSQMAKRLGVSKEWILLLRKEGRLEPDAAVNKSFGWSEETIEAARSWIRSRTKERM